jgi:hypothetical protein
MGVSDRLYVGSADDGIHWEPAADKGASWRAAGRLAVAIYNLSTSSCAQSAICNLQS